MEDVLEKDKPGQNTQGKEGEKPYLSEAYLIRAFLRKVDLVGVDLGRAYLHGADLSETYLVGVDLSEADLMSGMNITEEQIESVIINDATKIPDYLTAPAKLKKRVKKGTKG
jgi:uncharacterized protein YjbI with pentapeptide repeats